MATALRKQREPNAGQYAPSLLLSVTPRSGNRIRRRFNSRIRTRTRVWHHPFLLLPLLKSLRKSPWLPFTMPKSQERRPPIHSLQNLRISSKFTLYLVMLRCIYPWGLQITGVPCCSFRNGSHLQDHLSMTLSSACPQSCPHGWPSICSIVRPIIHHQANR